MAKYKIIVTQVIVEEREVDASSMKELNEKIEDQGQFIGRCVKPAFPRELSGKIYDEDGRLVQLAIFD